MGMISQRGVLQQQAPQEYESQHVFVCGQHEGFTVCWHAAAILKFARCGIGVVVCAGAVFQELKVLEGHSGSVLSVAVSADGSKIVSGSDDTTIRIWSAESGQVPLLDYVWITHGRASPRVFAYCGDTRICAMCGWRCLLLCLCAVCSGAQSVGRPFWLGLCCCRQRGRVQNRVRLG